MIYTALVLGLLGSLHCLGMCGPIAFMLPVDRKRHANGAFQLLLYHSGRLLAYGSIGLLFGILGRSFQLFGLQQKLSIIVGILMIALVLLPTRILNRFKVSQPIYRMVNKLKQAIGANFKRKTPDAFLTLGVLNGFLPCGLVYMAVMGAVAMADPWLGFGYMLIFGAGTIPLMTGAVYASGLLKSSFKSSLTRLIPVFVVIIGVLFILRGMGLGIPYISPKPSSHVASTSIECHQP